MGELFAKLIELFASGNRRVLWRLLFLILLIGILAPIAVNYFFGYSRLDQQVRLLKDVAQIDPSTFKDPRLTQFYNNVLNSLVRSQPAPTRALSVRFSVTSIASVFVGMNLWKFLSGASILLLLLPVAFIGKYDSAGARMGGILVLLSLAAILGFIGALIPTFEPAVINIIGFPFLQLALIVYLSYATSRSQKNKSDQSLPE